jgi:hypothetical protein
MPSASEQEKGTGHNPKGVVADDRNFNKDSNDRNNSDHESDEKSPASNAERKNSARRICAAACDDGVSCRMFLCGCCRSQVFVCRCCDRGQVYCIETCAQKARHDRQREARRRYQATPRGRAMHAERNRRYRARMRCVTDHGPAKEPEGRPSLSGSDPRPSLPKLHSAVGN